MNTEEGKGKIDAIVKAMKVADISPIMDIIGADGIETAR